MKIFYIRDVLESKYLISKMRCNLFGISMHLVYCVKAPFIRVVSVPKTTLSSERLYDSLATSVN